MSDVDVILALVRTAAVTVYDGVVPNKSPVPYAVLYSDLGDYERLTLSQLSDKRTVHFQTTSVGVTPEQARWVALKTRAVCIDALVPLDGRLTWRIAHESSQPVQRDDDLDPPVFYAVDQYVLASVPAPV